MPEVHGRALRTARRRWRPLLIAGLLLGVTAISVGLRLNAPTILVADAAFDDAHYAYQGWMIATDRWLGPYTYATVTKGPGYPLFIAAAFRSGIPLKLGEHLLHLAACSVLSVGAWRMTRVRGLAIALYCALVLDPSYLGEAASIVTRDGMYGSLSLLLVGALLLTLAEVPAAVQRGIAWTLGLVAVAGVAIGMIAAAYYITREERVWLVPTLVLVAAGSAAGWRDGGRSPWVLGAVGAAILVVTGVTSSRAIDEVRDRNRAAYGSRVIGDLAEGEAARAYAEWQRVDVGPVERGITVNTEQRHAVYQVSPAASELAPHLEGDAATRWMGGGCPAPSTDGCDYLGGHFVWAMREAAWQTGHEGSAAEAQEFFGRMADEIAAACDDGRLRCVDRGVATSAPVDRIDTGALWSSARRITSNLLTFDGAEPTAWAFQARDVQAWDDMLRPLRGMDLSISEYRRTYREASQRQEVVAGLTDLYRTLAIVGTIPAILGVILGVLPRHARHRRVAFLGLTLLVGAASRVAVLAVVDATAFPAGNGNYLLPATAFLVGFLIAGWWALGSVVTDACQTTASARMPAETISQSVARRRTR